MTLLSKKHLAKGTFKVNNERGLHTLPSSEIVKCASSFKSQVSLIYQRQSANAKSVMSILTLTASKGAQILIEAQGEDAEEAVQSIEQWANTKLHQLP